MIREAKLFSENPRKKTTFSPEGPKAGDSPQRHGGHEEAVRRFETGDIPCRANVTFFTPAPGERRTANGER